MYWNSVICSLNTYVSVRLTLTWDVLKYEQEIEAPDMTMRLTLTWDVLKSI